MAKYDKLRKLERNRLLGEYHKRHPEMSWGEVGKEFGITRQRARKIWEEQKNIEAAGRAASVVEISGGEG